SRSGSPPRLQLHRWSGSARWRAGGLGLGAWLASPRGRQGLGCRTLHLSPCSGSACAKTHIAAADLLGDSTSTLTPRLPWPGTLTRSAATAGRSKARGELTGGGDDLLRRHPGHGE